MKSDILLKIEKNIFLFSYFDSVYLFGSFLDSERDFHDIDILLLYSSYSSLIPNAIIEITRVLECHLNYPIDITALSFNEEKDTGFLIRLENKYLKLK
jgi:Nucleotidyltransferase domain.